MSKPRILIIEDDPDIVELLRYNLRREGFETLEASSGEEGLRLALQEIPSLVLLDLMLPGLQGLEVCRLLREQSRTRTLPIIVLTAKGEEADVVAGLEMGADDYVKKPFRVKEIVSRVRAVLRRAAPAPAPAEIVQVGPLLLDWERFECRLEGKPLPLTLSEFRLLHRLASRPGRVFTRDQLLDSLTEGRSVIVDRNVDVHIRALRRKLGQCRDLIVTVRGVGYKFRGPGEES